MTRDEAMARLEALGNPKIKAVNVSHGAGENHFGVNLSDVRALAKEIKSNHDLALELWETGNIDAMLLATLLMKPKLLSAADIDAMVRRADYFKVTDWLLVNIIKGCKHKDELRTAWVESTEDLVARAGWSLQAEKVREKDHGLDLDTVIRTIEARLKDAPFRTQENMNYCLVQIAVHHPEHRQRCLDIAERLEVFKDYPTSKGCISPYAPTWIAFELGTA